MASFLKNNVITQNSSSKINIVASTPDVRVCVRSVLAQANNFVRSAATEWAWNRCLCDTCKAATVDARRLQKKAEQERKRERRLLFTMKRNNIKFKNYLKNKDIKLVYDKNLKQSILKPLNWVQRYGQKNKFSVLNIDRDFQTERFEDFDYEKKKNKNKKFGPIIDWDELLLNFIFDFKDQYKDKPKLFKCRKNSTKYFFFKERISQVKLWCRDKMKNISTKQRNLISKLKKNFDVKDLDIPQVMGQMDTGETSINLDTKGITCIANTAEVATAQTAVEVVDPNDWVNMSTSQKIEYQDDVDRRWIPLQTITWSKDDAVGKELCSLTLPKDFVKILKGNPIAMKILQHTFFKANMVIKVKVSSNKFITGSVIAGFYYCDKFNDQFDATCNEYRYWYNMPGSNLLKANEENEVEIKVPFKYFASALTVQERRETADLDLDLGTFKIFVFTQFKTGSSNTVNKLPITLFMAFDDAIYYGVRSRVPIGQMLPVAQYAAMKLVDNLVSSNTPNRDLPAADISNVRVLPMSSTGVSAGRNSVSLCENLGFEPNSETQHMAGSGTSVDETSFKTIVRHQGYINTINWSINDAVGKILFETIVNPVSPDLPTRRYSHSGQQNVDLVLPTPLASIAGCFHLMRGNVEFTYDFMSSEMHSGLLKLVFIPYVTTCDQEMSLGSYLDYLDISTAKRYTKPIPYISNRPWISRRNIRKYQPGNFENYGLLQISVENPLVTMNSISDNVDIVVSMRGGEDMEFSVPIMPSFRPFLGPIKVELDAVTALDGYLYYQTGHWHSLSGTNNLIFRYGDGSDHVTQFTNNYDFRKVYKISYPDKPPGVLMKCYGSNKQTTLEVKWVGFGHVGSDWDHVYGFPITTPEQKDRFIKFVNEKNDDGSFKIQDHKFNWNTSWSADSTVTDSYKNSAFDGYYMHFIADESEVDGQIGEQKCIDLKCNMELLPTSNNGYKFFGEQFMNVKDLCRRFAPYDINTIKLPTTHMGCALVIPIVPMGLLQDEEKLYMYNNFQTYFCNMYRFGRGSMEFSLNLAYSKPNLATFMIQHRPEILNRDNKRPTDLPGFQQYLPGYGHTHNATTVNPNTKIRIPYYNPNNNLILGPPNFKKVDATNLYSLGELHVYKNCFSEGNKNLFYTCESSFSDDFKFSVYTSMPWCIPTYTLPPIPKLTETSSIVSLPEIKPKPIVEINLKKSCKKEDIPFEMVTHGQMMSWIFGKNEITEVGEDLGAAAGKGIMDYIAQYFHQITETFGTMIDNVKLVLANLMSNIVHLITNPSLTTLCISIASIGFGIGFITMNNISSITELFKNIYSKTIGRLFNNCDDNTPTGQLNESDMYDPVTGNYILRFDNSDKVALVSALVSGIVGAYGLKKYKDKHGALPNFLDTLTEGVTKGMSKANQVFIFFKNHFLLFEKMMRWCFNKLNPFSHDVGLKMLATENKLVERFLDDCTDILDPTNLEFIETDYSQIAKVFMCAMVATEIRHRFIKSEMLDKLVDMKFKTRRELLVLCDKVLSLRNKLIDKCKCVDVRYEPFTIWIYGVSNIGKSHMCDQIAEHLLNEINYVVKGPVSYVVTPGKKHADGANMQPNWVFDDFGQIIDPQSLVETLTLTFNLKSTATFRPPMASLEEKNKTFNPLLVTMLSNTGYPNYSGTVSCTEAFLRRRDVLVQVRLAPNYLSPEYYWKDLTPENQEILEKRKYLQFAFHTKPAATIDMEQNELEIFNCDGVHTYWLSWEQFKIALSLKHKNYHKAKSMDYIKRCQKIVDYNKNLNLDTNIIDVVKNYADYVTLFSEKEVEKEFYTSPNTSLLNLVNNLGRSDKEGDKLLYKSLKSSNNAFVLGSKFHDEQKLFDNCVAMGQIWNTKPSTSKDCKISVISVSEQIKEPVEIKLTKMEDINKLTNKKIVALLDEHKGYVSDLIAHNYREYCKLNNICENECCHYKFLQEKQYKGRTLENIYYDKEIVEELEDLDSDNLLKFGFFEIDGLYLPNFPCGKFCIFGDFDTNDAATFPSCYDRFIYRIQKGNELKFSGLNSITNFRMDGKYTDSKTKEQIAMDAKLKETVKIMKQQYCDTGKVTILKENYLGKHYWTYELLSKVAKVMIVIGACYVSHKYVAPAISSVAAVAGTGIGKAINWTFGRERIIEPKTIEGEIYQENNVKKTPLRTVNSKSVVGQMSIEQRLGYINKIKANTFYLQKNELVGRCFGLKERFFLMPYHYCSNFEEKIDQSPDKNDLLMVRMNDCMKTVRYSQLKMYRLQDSELVLAQLPNKFHNFKDVLGNLIKSENTSCLGMQGFVVEVSLNEQLQMEVKDVDLRFSYVDSAISINDGMGKNNVADRLVTYNFSKKGACMSVLVAESSHFPSIIGFHVAGHDSGQGYAELVVRETFESFILNKITAVGQIDYDPCLAVKDLIKEVDSDLIFIEGVKPLGVVKQQYRVFNPNNSKLKHSLLYNEIFESTYDFPLLSVYDSRINAEFSPLREGCKYHGMDPISFDEEVINLAFEDYNDMVLENCLPLRQKIGVISFDDAVLGLQMDNYEPVNLNTSEGFPYVCQRPVNGHNKKWLLQVDQITRQVNVHDLLRETYNKNMQLRKEGKAGLTVFIDCLKDQKMPKEKAIVPGKTRVFSTSPVDYTIAVKQYYGDWSASFKAYRENLEHRVGMNVFSREWDFLARKMLSYNRKIGALDYSKFGPTLMAEVSFRFPDMVNNWYNKNQFDKTNLQQENLVRKVLHEECVKSIHLAVHILYLTSTGNPSGHPLTVEVNCFVNCIYIRVCFIEIDENKQLNLHIFEFRLLISLVTYGDDLIISIKQELLNHVKLVDFCNVLKKYTIKATPASKLDNDAEFLDITHPDTTFLKGTFVRHPFRNIYIYKLDRRALEEIINWSTKSDDELSNLIDTCRAFLENIHSYGKNEYEKYRIILLNYFHSRFGVTKLGFSSWIIIDNNRYN